MTNKNYIDECLERAEKAPKGPWKYDSEENWIMDFNGRMISNPHSHLSGYRERVLERDAIGELMAHARMDVVELANRLQKACEKLREVHAELEDVHLGYVEHDGSHLRLAEELEAPLQEGK